MQIGAPTDRFYRAALTIANVQQSIAQNMLASDDLYTSQDIFKSFKTPMVEVMHDITTAVETHNLDAHRDGLANLLLLMLMQSQIAYHNQQFDFKDAVKGIHNKLLRRILPKSTQISAEEHWNTVKAAEKEKKIQKATSPKLPTLQCETSRFEDTVLATKNLNAYLAYLRGPDGEEWDRARNFDNLKVLLIEEVSELIEAIDRGDSEDHCDEMGDVLMLIFLQCEVAYDEKKFDLENLAKSIFYLNMPVMHF